MFGMKNSVQFSKLTEWDTGRVERLNLKPTTGQSKEMNIVFILQ